MIRPEPRPSPHMDYPARRRQNLARGLRKDGLDAFLVTNPLNVSYLTGFTGDSSFLLLTPRRAILVSDDRFRVQIEEECPGLEAYIRPHDRNTWQATAEVIDKLGARNVGVESQHLTLAGLETLKDLAPAVDWAPRRDRVEQLRAIKDPSEVEAIRRAIRAAERAFAMLRATISERDTEKELADALEGYVRRAGGETGAFPAIVAIGDRSALPHAPPTARAAGEAGFLLVDWGARRGMY
ncbi:MAG TPA: aminopeptidase P family N-terminal domain-containing protein, partial [Gemmataceae bacterium]